MLRPEWKPGSVHPPRGDSPTFFEIVYIQRPSLDLRVHAVEKRPVCRFVFARSLDFLLIDLPRPSAPTILSDDSRRCTVQDHPTVRSTEFSDSQRSSLGRRTEPMNHDTLRLGFYYSLKPILPRTLQILLRRQATRFKLRNCLSRWPINAEASKTPKGWGPAISAPSTTQYAVSKGNWQSGSVISNLK